MKSPNPRSQPPTQGCLTPRRNNRRSLASRCSAQAAPGTFCASRSQRSPWLWPRPGCKGFQSFGSAPESCTAGEGVGQGKMAVVPLVSLENQQTKGGPQKQTTLAAILQTNRRAKAQTVENWSSSAGGFHATRCKSIAKGKATDKNNPS